LILKISDNYVPSSDDVKDNLFVTKTLDSHFNFQSIIEDVLNLYQQITGKEYELN